MGAMTTPHQKYQEAAKVRAQRVLALREQGFTMDYIAKRVRVTRQRVQQILAKEKGK
jgi:transcriptional regulator